MTASPFDEITEAQLLPRIVRLGGNLYGAVFTLMKLVPARYILVRALERGDLGSDTLIVETTSGTFGLALAMQARLLRRPCVLVSDLVIDRNLQRRLVDLGARVEICREALEVGGYQAARLRRLAQIRAEYPDNFWPNQYSNPDNPGSYVLVAEHLARTLGTIDCLVGPVGSGGSMCGTIRGLRSGGSEVQAIAVDTHHSVLFGQLDSHRNLRGLGNSLMPPNLDHKSFDEVHWCTEAEAYAATRDLHRTYAVFQGPTSGAAYQVARWWADRHPDAQCVVMLPDEGYRYQDTVYDDGWLTINGINYLAAPRSPIELSHPSWPAETWSWFPWRRRTYQEVMGDDSPLPKVELEQVS